MSSSHIHFPAVPPLESISDLPHEIYAAQQRQHQQRLNHWSSVMCPIPTCKRYSPIAADTILRSDVSVRSDDSNRSRSSGSPAETLASGVLYYPPPSALPAYTAEIPIRMEPNTLLLDITVDKILNLVKTELKTPFSEDAYDRSSHRSHAEYEDDSDDSEAEAGPSGSAAMHTSLSRDMSNLGQPSGTSSSHRNKRQRGALRPVGSPDEWPFRRDLQSVIECDVCAMMLFDPVTTPCQHSFCYKCLSRSLDHSNRCPVCRQDLPGFAFFQDHSVNRVLLAVIKTVFKDAYAERQLAIEREERDALLDTPIFVCTLAFPGMPTILHVFEPRYRLMIRRCIESSSPRFGMVLPSHGTGQPGTQGVMEYGTMLEIQSVQMLPDGRSMVETVGSYRFKLLEKGNLDGYTVGRIERIDDITPAEELALEQSSLASSSEDHTALGLATDAILDAGGPTTTPAFGLASSGGAIPMPPLTQSAIDDETRSTEEYMTICRSFIDQLRSGSAPWLLQRLNNTYGTMPTDPSEFSYWMALVMPIDEYEKAKLLPIRSPRLRLKLIVHWVESLRSSWW
ncbi:PUA-like domain-containing protein [Kockovaella imperatae]|uniref:PUA-like domain-containing protein n=1 Tax=Kockovaella imperatae TaxID=4999 RepID=A0A1Y1UFV3_9TREE|nr:PUA-like domain-containing protein [Kockovaella imperatae]ORX36950.1 PUA-like domain-containing protein [Kockovaella imperatae]